MRWSSCRRRRSPACSTDAEAAGVKSATIYAAAMGDGHDPESHKRGAWLKDFLGRSKIKVAGPNCMGAYSYHERMFAYPNTELGRFPAGSVGAHLPVGRHAAVLAAHRRRPRPALLLRHHVRQRGQLRSRRLSELPGRRSQHQGRSRCSSRASAGPRPSWRRPARALAAGKPIVAIKTGATAKSRAAAQSHTGAIGGDYAAYLAMCERYGIYNCRSLDDMLEAALAFDGGRLPKGPRIGFVTTSGGTVDLLYDYAEAEGAAMPDYRAGDAQGPDALHAGRHRAEEPARPRHSRWASSTPPASARSSPRIRTST